MKTLIKYYDKDVLKNIMATLTLQPDKVVFFYDKGIQDLTYFYGMRKCFRKHIPNIILETHPVDILNMEEIYTKTIDAIGEGTNCMMELTGGSELMMIAGYKAGSEKKIELLYTDLVNGVIMNLLDSTRVQKTTVLTLDDFVDARGARFIGNSHLEPQPERYKDIMEMSRILFENLWKWKQTSGYLQTVTARVSPHELHIESRLEVSQKSGKKVSPNKKLLQAFQKYGFIRNLKMTKENMSFSFSSWEEKQYVISYGVWLELYVFISAKMTGAFDDVKLGTMIDWNAYDGLTVAGNEIDVILSDNSLPVFISCKLRNADTAALNELLIAKKRVGGWFSKGIIVAFGRDKQDKTGSYKRAKELGIELLDSKDILSLDFGERLVKTIREHDLVSLKWKKL